MKKLWGQLVVGALVIGSCMNIVGQEVQSNTQGVTANCEVQNASTNYLEINGQIYVPFKWVLNQVGIQDFKWENGKKGGNTKAYITVDAPAYFWGFYMNMLTWGLEPDEEESTNMPLPESLKGIVPTPESKVTEVENMTSLNKKPINLTVTSQGYETGRVIYNYKIVDGTLYLPVDEIKGYFGIGDVSVDKVTHKAVVQ